MVLDNVKNPPRMQTINEVAREFGLARHFVREKVLRGEVVYVCAGKKYLINAEKFAEWLNQGEQAREPGSITAGKIRHLR